AGEDIIELGLRPGARFERGDGVFLGVRHVRHVGAENQPAGAPGGAGAFERRTVIARRVEVAAAQVVTRRVRAAGKTLIAAIDSVQDHRQAAAEVREDDFYVGTFFEHAGEDKPG